MQTSEAKAILVSMLDEVGFDFNNPDPKLAWKTFKTFVQEPVECAEDGILFECGTFSFTGEELYYLEFVRQFSIDNANGEYGHMEQLRCCFTCQPTDTFSQLQTNLWAFDFETLNVYFAAVEKLTEFQISIENPRDWSCDVSQDEI